VEGCLWQERDLSDKVAVAWRNFAQRGDPNNINEAQRVGPSSVSGWKQFDSRDNFTFVLDYPPKQMQDGALLGALYRSVPSLNITNGDENTSRGDFLRGNQLHGQAPKRPSRMARYAPSMQLKARAPDGARDYVGPITH
jgi:hypothetical protein